MVIPPSGSASPDPYQSFSSAPLPASLQSKFAEKGFTRPSPIQAQCWPVMLAGDDIVGIAETGSGKTLAFAVPFLSKMSGSKKKGGKEPLRMLVLAPTRELAQQSYEVLDDFGSAVGATSLVVYGGVPKHEQVRVLKRGVGCVVATPGRLKDLCNDGSCDLSGVDLLVLDEADRMLDMGFEQDVRYIISMCAAVGSRQTAMFSATWPAAIRDLASEFMREVTRVYVGFESIAGSNGEGEVDDSLSANRRVSQTVEVIEDRARDARIREVSERVLVSGESGERGANGARSEGAKRRALRRRAKRDELRILHERSETKSEYSTSEARQNPNTLSVFRRAGRARGATQRTHKESESVRSPRSVPIPSRFLTHTSHTPCGSCSRSTTPRGTTGSSSLPCTKRRPRGSREC